MGLIEELEKGGALVRKGSGMSTMALHLESPKLPVKLFTAPNCPFCPEARQFAADNKIAVTEFDVSRDECLLEAYKFLVMKTPSFVVNGIAYNLNEFKLLVEGGLL